MSNQQVMQICQTPIAIGLLLNTVETPLIGALFLVALLNARLIWASAVLHPNLKAILLTQSLFMLAYSIFRLYTLYWILKQQQCAILLLDPTLLNIVMTIITNGNMFGHIMILERTVATLLARRYEQCKNVWFNGAWIVFMILFTLLQLWIPSLSLSINGGFGVAVVVNHIALAFAWLNGRNRRNFNNFRENIHVNNSHEYQLSERYQLLENIYSGRQLTPSFFFHSMNILCTNIVCVARVYTNASAEVFSLIVAVSYLVHAFSKLGIEITLIIFHPVLKRNLQLLCNNRCFRCLPFCKARITTIGHQQRGAISRISPKQDNDGQQSQKQQNEHFRMLEKYWQ